MYALRIIALPGITSDRRTNGYAHVYDLFGGGWLDAGELLAFIVPARGLVCAVTWWLDLIA